MIDLIEETAEHYNQVAGIDSFNSPDREKMQRLFLQYFSHDNRLLELGCGAGRDSKFFSENGLIVTGIDISDRFVEMSKINCPGATFLKQDLRNPDFPAESFEGIWAHLSFMHIPRTDALPALQKYAQLLTANGVIFLELFAGVGADQVKSPRTGKTRLFTKYQISEITALLNQANFSVLLGQELTDLDGDKMLAIIAKKNS